MGVTVRVLAQYWENKAWYEGGEAWKPKGGHEFVFENVDSDALLYANDLKAVLSQLVVSQNDDMYRYEYRDHEVIFHEPTKLDADSLIQGIRLQWQEQEQD